VAKAVAAGQPVHLDSDGKKWDLLPEDVTVKKSEAPDFVLSDEKGLTVAINTRVTPELEREGLGRDLVRHIQQMRKEADLDLMDRIEVAYETTDPLLLQTIAEYSDFICGETLCEKLFRGHCESGKEVKLAGHAVVLEIGRV
jgi:isoleucyl-tRNA synthetase